MGILLSRKGVWCVWIVAPRNPSGRSVNCPNLQRMTPLRQNESFKQDKFYKPRRRQTVMTVSLRING
jgi:hypothetical protein